MDGLNNFVSGFVIGFTAAAIAGYVFLSKSVCLFGSCAVF